MHELAVQEALPHLSTTELDAMREANARFADALQRKDPDAATTADDDFHGVLVTASTNDAIRDVLERYTPVLRRLERLRFSSLSGRKSVAQHERIIALCEAGDVRRAAAATRSNWMTLAPLIDNLDAGNARGSGPSSTDSST
jgi:DNA-binding GntR family transcriptional regulator